jgi:hypothetical protein
LNKQNFYTTKEEGRKITKNYKLGINFSAIATFLFLFIFSLSFISALETSSWDDDRTIVPGANYSINVNYSEESGNAKLFDDYSVSGLYTYYKGLLETYFNGIYASISDLSNYWSKTENINATGYNVTADTITSYGRTVITYELNQTGTNSSLKWIKN